MSDIVVFSSPPADVIGTLAMPLRDSISAEAHVSLMQTDYGFANGRKVGHLYVQGSQLPLQRNVAVHRMQGQWLLFIDDDMVFDSQAVGRLVASYWQLKAVYPEPLMVGGLCVRRYPPYDPTAYRALDMVEGPFQPITEWDGMDYIEVDATGTAFLLIEPSVFAAIMGGPFPSFEERESLRPWPHFEWTGGLGEDLRFCLKAKAAGCRIFVDTTITIGHLGTKVFTHEPVQA